jgi:copper chaperone CopZ
MATVTSHFMTEGLHCASCARLVQMTVEDLEGVTGVTSDFETGLTVVEHDAEALTPDDIIAAIVQAGYGARLAEAE